MIFPFLSGILHPLRAPMTYFLLVINLFVFVATYDSYSKTDARLNEIMEDDRYLETQGSAFADMIEREPEHFSETLRTMGKNSSKSDAEMRRMLGSLAFRNSAFMSSAASFEFSGDDVAIASWKAKFLEVEELQAAHPTFKWGLSTSHPGWMQYFSYQFAHSGWDHLFWNMIFLILFGCFLETTLGGSFVIIGYVGGGLIGALAFSSLSGISSSPLVGASGAVSGLMGLVAFAWMGVDRIRFFYWLLPVRGYYGFALLPSWLVLIVSFVPDLSGYLSASKEFGSVAYSAHIGGAAFGGLMAFALKRGWLVRDVDDDDWDDELEDDVDRDERERRSKRDDDRKAG
ncbi:MAG: rhomboid family intramembrane serine protease [Bdellovibrionota bacterium]